jgi:hypothetical protein
VGGSGRHEASGYGQPQLLMRFTSVLSGCIAAQVRDRAHHGAVVAGRGAALPERAMTP